MKRTSKFLKLKESLYGLKQAPLNWYKTLSSWIKENGFKESESNPCLYLHKEKVTALYFHVDDLLVVEDTEGFNSKFLRRFKDSSAHEVDTLLGMKVDVGQDIISLYLPNHIKKGLEEMNLLDAKPIKNPCTSGLHLQPATNQEAEDFKKLNRNYRSPIGRLNFIATLAWLDISYSVSNLARFSENPGITHWKKVEHVWRYLLKTIN